MLKKLFVEHPQSVGESYWQHMGVAFSFGFEMLGAALACIIHGFVPGLFKSTGSQTIIALHERLVTNRRAKHHARANPAHQSTRQGIALASQPTLDFSI